VLQRQKRSRIGLTCLERLTRNSQPSADFINNPHESARWVIGFRHCSPYNEKICASFYRFCRRYDPFLVMLLCP
jgi:hypothetical protein